MVKINDGGQLSAILQAARRQGVLNKFNKEDLNGIFNGRFGRKSDAQTQINPDGSGTRVTKKVDKKTGNITETVETLGKGGVLLKKQTRTENNKGRVISTGVSEYKYDENGKQIGLKSTTKKGKNTTTIDRTFNENGKLVHEDKVVTQRQGRKNLTSKISTDYEYDANNNLKRSTKTGTDSSGNPTSSVTEYENNRKVSSHSTFYKRGALTETYTDYRASAAGLPSTEIIYGPDGKTIQQKVENVFDEEGILSGQKVTDADGKVTTHDFSEVDGNFDIGCQKGRGDCYLLAGINALRQTPEGMQMLKENIEVSIDENGKKVYTITFPGAKIAREALISGEGGAGIRALPEDKVYIQESYTITEDELDAALKQQGKKYSAGDRDIVLLEVGFEKYRKDVDKTVRANNINARQTSLVAGLAIGAHRVGTSDVLSSGQGADAIFILTGKKSEYYYHRPSGDKPATCYVNADLSMVAVESGESLDEAMENSKATNVYENKISDEDKVINELIRDSADGQIDEYAATAGFIVSSQEVGGEVIVGGGHEFTIKSMTKDSVELINPWDPSKTITMSMKDFKKSITSISITPIKDEADAQTQSPIHQPAAALQSQNAASRLQNLISSMRQSTDNRPNYTVPSRMNYTTIIINALKKQGVQKPTMEQISKALEQFLKANPDSSLQLNKGNNDISPENMFLPENTEIFIPEFDV